MSDIPSTEPQAEPVRRSVALLEAVALCDDRTPCADTPSSLRVGDASVFHPCKGRGTLRFLRSLLGATLSILLLAPIGDAVAEGDDKPGVRNWSMFRGNPHLTGVVHGELPDRLEVRWTFEAPEAVGSSAAIDDGVVYVGCDDEFLYALDLDTGKVRWKYQAKEMIRSSPTVVDGTVFFGDDEGVLHAVDASTGAGKWTFQTDAQIISSPNHDAGRIVFGSYDGFVYCLSARDGKLIWKFETEGRVHGTPGIAAGHVMVAGCDEYLHVLRLDNGQSVTKVSMGSVSGASAAIHGPRVYVGTYGGRVLGIDWKSGRVVWAFQDPDREFPYLASAAVTEGAILIGGRDKWLRALSPATGRLQWTFVTKGRIDSSPVVVEDRVFFGSSDGNLYAVDIQTGREVWRFEAGGPISASPAVANRCLVVGTEDGVIYCFGSR